MKILLTGATGFLGSLLAEELIKKGYFVRALVRNPNRLRWPIDKLGENIEIVKGDVTSVEGLEEAAKGMEIIIHLAGLTKALNFEQYYIANAKSCELLINARDKKKFKQFIFTSSQAAGGPTMDAPRKEEDEELPLSNYGLTKLKGEEIVKKSCVKYTILRPASIYGERDVEFYPLFKSIRRGWKLILGDGKNLVNLIYVKDLIKAILLAINNKKAFNKTYNVCDGVEYNWIDINNAAEKASGRKCRTLKLPMFSANILGFFNNIIEKIIKKPLLLNKEKVREMKQVSWLMDTTKIKSDLKFNPDFNLEDGFKRTFNWYVENKWIKKLKNKE